MANIKKVFGIGNKKKPDDSDEDSSAYSDPAVVHATEPPPRNVRGISQPHYPPPRPQHSPNPRRKNPADTTAVQGNKRPPANENKRNSVQNLGSVEPRRAPPRPNIGKKNDEDDYCDPIDIQRKDDFVLDKNSSAKDDYCEPWDSTTKADYGKKFAKKIGYPDDENNEYMDPYDAGKDGIIEKRMSRGIVKDFGLHGKPDQKIEPESRVYDQVYEARKGPSDDYDVPWEWKKQMQANKVKAPKPKLAPQSQRPKPSSGPSDNYDEPWEKKQGYLLKNQLPAGGSKQRSPVPLPRGSVVTPEPEGQVYDRPWEPNQTEGHGNHGNQESLDVYETPWEQPGKEMNGSRSPREASPRRASQPAMSSVLQQHRRKTSHPAVLDGLDNYDTPWEYKKQFAGIAPPKPARLSEEATEEVNPDLPLDSQIWYHGPIKRLEAEELLRNALDCSYLVRNSESSKKDFSLSMKNNDNFLHLKIVRQLDGQFILGQFSKPFLDIPKVIYHYSRNKLNIRGAEHKLLKHPIPSQPEYHTIEPDDAHL